MRDLSRAIEKAITTRNIMKAVIFRETSKVMKFTSQEINTQACVKADIFPLLSALMCSNIYVLANFVYLFKKRGFGEIRLFYNLEK